MDPLAEKDNELFTKSERLLQEFRRGKDGFSANDLKELIQKVLHHPEFEAADVDHNMHDRLMNAVEKGTIDVLDFWKDGDGEQEVCLYKRKVEQVLRELLADERLAGTYYVFQILNSYY